MKKNLLLITLLITMCQIGKAQVGINQNAPKANLDISAATTTTYAEGLLIPKVSVSSLDKMSSRYKAEQDGVLVNVTEITTSTDSKTSEVTKVGFYYYDNPTSKWKATNIDLGNGSFTPTSIQLGVSKTINWNTYKTQTYNYFEFYEDGSLNSIVNMPKPDIFENKTIYFRNNTGGNVIVECSTTDFPPTNNPDGSQTPNVGLGGGLLSLNLFGTQGTQLYSDGTRWYLMTAQNTY